MGAIIKVIPMRIRNHNVSKKLWLPKTSSKSSLRSLKTSPTSVCLASRFVEAVPLLPKFSFGQRPPRPGFGLGFGPFGGLRSLFGVDDSVNGTASNSTQSRKRRSVDDENYGEYNGTSTGMYNETDQGYQRHYV